MVVFLWIKYFVVVRDGRKSEYFKFLILKFFYLFVYGVKF